MYSFTRLYTFSLTPICSLSSAPTYRALPSSKWFWLLVGPVLVQYRSIYYWMHACIFISTVFVQNIELNLRRILEAKRSKIRIGKSILYNFHMPSNLSQLVPWYQLYLLKWPTHPRVPSVDMFPQLVPDPPPPSGGGGNRISYITGGDHNWGGYFKTGGNVTIC